MCVKAIVDASAFRHFKEGIDLTAGKQMRTWVSDGDGIIVYSVGDDKYGNELKRDPKVLGYFRQYQLDGNANKISDNSLSDAAKLVPKRPSRRSNDCHVLALALAGRATVLFSLDRKLRNDFIDTDVLPPVGKHQRCLVPNLVRHEPADTKRSQQRQSFFGSQRCQQE